MAPRHEPSPFFFFGKEKAAFFSPLFFSNQSDPAACRSVLEGISVTRKGGAFLPSPLLHGSVFPARFPDVVRRESPLLFLFLAREELFPLLRRPSAG